MFRGKKYQDSAKLIDNTKLYDPSEALDLVVKTAKAKFDETIEVHIRLEACGSAGKRSRCASERYG